jgi:hypothetical protein
MRDLLSLRTGAERRLQENRIEIKTEDLQSVRQLTLDDIFKCLDGTIGFIDVIQAGNLYQPADIM